MPASTMNPVHAGNATRMAIRFTEQLTKAESLAVPAALDVLAASGPVGEMLAEHGWIELASACGETRVPRPHTRAMIRAMCDHVLAGIALAARTAAAETDEIVTGPTDPFAGLPTE